jgi:hypothetical protein
MTIDPRFVLSDVNPGVVDAFVDYHRDNPHLYDAFKRYSYELKRAGRSHFGAKAIMERIRYESALAGNDEYKINNSYASCYARVLAWEDPVFSGFFEMRTRRAA